MPPVVQLPPQIPQDIDVNQDIGGNQIPKIQKAETIKGKAFLSPTLFQPPKTTPFRVANNIGQMVPNMAQQPVLDYYPKPVRNVSQDPITQHTDQRAKPRVYESLIKP